MKERFVLKIYIPVKLETNLFSRLSDYSFKRILKAVSIAKLSKDRSPSSRNIVVVVVVVVIVVNRIHINLSLVTAKFPNRVSSSGRSYRCINSTSRFQVHIYIHTHTYIRTRKVYSYRERARDAKQGMFTRQRGKGPSSSRCVVLGPTTGRNESKPG